MNRIRQGDIYIYNPMKQGEATRPILPLDLERLSFVEHHLVIIVKCETVKVVGLLRPALLPI